MCAGCKNNFGQTARRLEPCVPPDAFAFSREAVWPIHSPRPTPGGDRYLAAMPPRARGTTIVTDGPGNENRAEAVVASALQVAFQGGVRRPGRPGSVCCRRTR